MSGCACWICSSVSTGIFEFQGDTKAFRRFSLEHENSYRIYACTERFRYFLVLKRQEKKLILNYNDTPNFIYSFEDLLVWSNWATCNWHPGLLSISLVHKKKKKGFSNFVGKKNQLLIETPPLFWVIFGVKIFMVHPKWWIQKPMFVPRTRFGFSYTLKKYYRGTKALFYLPSLPLFIDSSKCRKTIDCSCSHMDAEVLQEHSLWYLDSKKLWFKEETSYDFVYLQEWMNRSTNATISLVTTN